MGTCFKTKAKKQTKETANSSSQKAIKSDSKDEDQFILFADASNDGNLKLMKKISADLGDQKKEDLLYYKDANDNTPLHLAALNGNVKICQFLAQEMVTIDWVKAVTLVNALNKNGQTALTCVCLRGYLTKGDKQFAKRDRIKIVKLLLNLKADPNIKHPETFMTCLHWAAQNDDEETVRILMENKVDPFIFSEQDRLPIDIAGSANSVECVDVFLNFFEAENGIQPSEQSHGTSQDQSPTLAQDRTGAHIDSTIMEDPNKNNSIMLENERKLVSFLRDDEETPLSERIESGDKPKSDGVLPAIESIKKPATLIVEMDQSQIEYEGGSPVQDNEGVENQLRKPSIRQSEGLEISSNGNSQVNLFENDLSVQHAPDSEPAVFQENAQSELVEQSDSDQSQPKMIVSLATMNFNTDPEVNMNMIDLDYIEKNHFESDPDAKALCRYLYWACYRNRLKLVKYIVIKKKISPFFKILEGKSPLMAAIEGSATGVLKTLLTYDYCYDGNDSYMQEWKQEVDSFGNNPLHMAMRSRNPNIIRILLETGWGDMQSRNWMGKTPLQEPHNNPLTNAQTLRVVLDYFKREGFPEDVDEGDFYSAPKKYTDEEIIEKLAKKGISLNTKEAHYCFICNQKRLMVLFSQLETINKRYREFAIAKGLEETENLLSWQTFRMTTEPEETQIVLVFFTDQILNIKAEQIGLQTQLQGRYQTLPFETTSKRFFQRFPASQQIYLIKKIFKEQFHIETLVAGGIVQDHFMLHTKERGYFTKLEIKQTVMLALSMLGDGWTDYFSFIQLVAQYYGEKYAFYLAFLMHNIAFLIPPAIFGTVIFVYHVKKGIELQAENEWFLNSFFKHSDDMLNLIYILFIGVWSTLYIEFWKRKQNTLYFMWGLEGRQTEAENSQTIPQKNTEWTIGVISGKKERQILDDLPWYVQFQSFALISIALIFAFAVWYVPMKILKELKQFEDGDIYKDIWDLGWTFIYGLLMIGLNKVFLIIAERIVVLENHKYLNDYQDSLTSKTALLILINSFFGLFMAAFVDQAFDQVQKLIASLIILKMFIINVIQLVINQVSKGSKFVARTLRIKRHFKKYGSEYKNEKEKDDHLNAELQLGMSSQPNLLVEDYSNLVIQFGWLTFFSPCFAIGAVFQLFSCICQLLHHKDYMSNFRRRDNPMLGKDIGIWLDLLSTMSIVSFTVSVGLATITSNVLYCMYNTLEDVVDNSDIESMSFSSRFNILEQQAIYQEQVNYFNLRCPADITPQDKIGGIELTWPYVIIILFSIEHIMIVFKFVLDLAIPDTPEWVEKQQLLVRYRIKQIHHQIQDMRLYWKLEKENHEQILKELLQKEHQDQDFAGMLVQKIQQGCDEWLQNELNDADSLATESNLESDGSDDDARKKTSKQDKERKLKKIFANAW